MDDGGGALTSSAFPLKYARIERERRFLLGGVPPGVDPAAGFERFDDLYLDGTTLRLRVVSAPDGTVLQRKLNQKRPGPTGAPGERSITSVYLEPGELALLSRLPGARLSKRRHRLAWEGRELGIDVFLGPLAGLVLAEVEAESDAALRACPLPPFARCEVTDLPLFTGGMLAREDPAAVLERARELLGG